MLRLLADENFSGEIVRGLRLRGDDLDLERVQDVGLTSAEDPAVLAWAAAHGRILLTHDRATMPSFAYERVVAGEPMAGVIVVSDRMPVRNVIDELDLIDRCSRQDKWRGWSSTCHFSRLGDATAAVSRPSGAATIPRQRRPSGAGLGGAGGLQHLQFAQDGGHVGQGILPQPVGAQIEARQDRGVEEALG